MYKYQWKRVNPTSEVKKKETPEYVTKNRGFGKRFSQLARPPLPPKPKKYPKITSQIWQMDKNEKKMQYHCDFQCYICEVSKKRHEKL